MRRGGWVALGIGAAVAAVAATAAIERPDLATATAQATPTRTESEIRSLDIEFYERRVAEDSFSAADRSRLASLYLQRARESGSYADYERAASLARGSLGLREAHNASTYVTLVSALLAQHEFVEALRMAQRLHGFDTADVSHTAVLAEVELETGDYASAARHFGQVATNADKPSVAARLARWYEVTGQLDRARGILRRSASRLATSADVPREQLAWFHYRLGELDLRRGELAAADSAFRRALTTLPNDYRALGGLARLAAARGAWRDALDWGGKAIAVQLDPATLGTMSDAYAALGDTTQARSFADAMATSALSQPGAIHRAWGLFLLDHDRDVQRVLRDARVSIAARRDVYGHDLLAWASYKAGEIDDAQRAATAALAQNTEDAMLLYHAGMIALAAGDSSLANARLSSAIAMNPYFGALNVARAHQTLAALGVPPSPRREVSGGSGGV